MPNTATDLFFDDEQMLFVNRKRTCG